MSLKHWKVCVQHGGPRLHPTYTHQLAWSPFLLAFLPVYPGTSLRPRTQLGTNCTRMLWEERLDIPFRLRSCDPPRPSFCEQLSTVHRPDCDTLTRMAAAQRSRRTRQNGVGVQPRAHP